MRLKPNSSHIAQLHSHGVGTSRSPLLPLFRSQTQIRVLTELFCGAEDELTVSELAERIELPLSSVAREVNRLADANILDVRRRGRSQFVSANRALPWAEPLTDLLDRTTGPAAAVAEAFSTLDGVFEVWIFGSWAARQRGEPGPAPHDIDVVVVGAVSPLAVSRAARTAERRTHVPVNAITVDPADWASPEAGSFLANVKAGPLVPVDRTIVDA
jgi:DNA-binding transcriptional ArsR family regulator